MLLNDGKNWTLSKCWCCQGQRRLLASECSSRSLAQPWRTEAPAASRCTGVAGAPGLALASSASAPACVPTCLFLRALVTEAGALFHQHMCVFLLVFVQQTVTSLRADSYLSWLALHLPERRSLIIMEDTRELLAYVGYISVYLPY